MIILGIDFETTGLNIPTIGVTEVGMVLWDTDLAAPIRMVGMLVNPRYDAVWEPGVEKVNNLTPAICEKHGSDDEKTCKQVLSWYGSADVLCAHNGNNFDKPLLDTWATRYGLATQKSKLWIDTRADIDRPPRDSHRLGYMAADHGFLNPFPHRAMFDVMTMFTILMAKDIAKTRGYHPFYQDGKFIRWELEVKEINLDKEREAARLSGFEIEVIR